MSEKTNEEKIIEYIWLHADESPKKIQAGILREFGENRSLNRIAQEQKAYLAEAEPSVKEDASAAPSIDEEAVKRVTAKFPSATEELIRKIVWFKLTTRFGCRRISQKLNHAVGKDTVQNIWKTYVSTAKPCTQPSKSSKSKEQNDADGHRTQAAYEEELAKLRERNEALERENVYRRLKAEGDALIVHIAEREMAKIHLETYQRFRQYCEREHLSTLETLRKMDIMAFSLFVSFPDWYTIHAESEECKLLGMEALKWEVTLEVDKFLRAKDAKERETRCKAKRKNAEKKTDCKQPETPRNAKAFTDHEKRKQQIRPNPNLFPSFLKQKPHTNKNA